MCSRFKLRKKHLLQSGVMDLWSLAVMLPGEETSSAVQAQLKNVQQIQASAGAFAAIRSDGSVVSWGNHTGGDSSAVQDQLRDVQQMQASRGAFAAILSDGSVVAWGDALFGGDSIASQDQLRDVQQIKAAQASGGAFCCNPE